MQINLPFDPVWLIVAGVVIVVLAVLVWASMRSSRRKRSERYRQRYGSEYDRALRHTGSQRAAEEELDEREARHDSLRITDLPDEERERYLVRWDEVQVHFVDAPEQALQRADALIREAMRERGYDAADDPYRRADDLAFDHPRAVEHYRQAHDLLAGGDSNTSTEDLRQALLHIRATFDAIVGAPAGEGGAGAGWPSDAYGRVTDDKPIGQSTLSPPGGDKTS